MTVVLTTAETIIPGPPRDPVYGWRGNYARFLRDPVGYLTYLYENYGELASIAEGETKILFAFGPQYNRDILKNIDVFFTTGLTVPGPIGSAQRRAGYGLFSTNGDQNKRHRQVVMPPFHRHSVGAYRDAMVESVEAQLQGWTVGGCVDMLEEMRSLSLRNAFKVFLGLDWGPGDSRIGGLIKRWMNLSSSVSVRLAPKGQPSAAYRRMTGLAQQLEQEVMTIIDRKRASRDGGGGTDLLSILLHAHDRGEPGFGRAELVGQIIVLLAASYETTADALNWTLFLLAQHPSVMADLYDELTGTLAGDPPTVAQLDELPLLDRVLKESMRILPPIAYNSRTCITATRLGSHELRKGTTVVFSHYITHRIPDLYPKPKRFIPDRWLTLRPSPYAYLPFGAGPRMCIGKAFSIQAIKIALAMILQRHRVRVVPGSRIDRFVRITLTSRRGMPMQLLPHNDGFKGSLVEGSISEMVDLS